MESLPRSAGRWWSLISGERKRRALIIAAALIAATAAADWNVGLQVSLGALYVLPIMLIATVLPKPQVLAAALFCALLRIALGPERTWMESTLTLAMASTAYTAAGFFVAELMRNRRLQLTHVAEMAKQQALRREAEEQLRLLAESSPAAILTLDADGRVRAANRAAHEMLAFDSGRSLLGEPISEYLPVLADALKLDTGDSEFRTAAQCRGKRRTGELFIAHTWFSTYSAAGGRRLAAIAVDSSEEMRDREEQNLRYLLRSHRILAGAVSHDMRNLCSAIGVVYSNLKRFDGLGASEDFQALGSLVEGLAKVASTDLMSRVREGLTGIDLRNVLDQLRIIIEPAWEEIDGVVRWNIPDRMPDVIAEPTGLLQAFLNVAQNSHRAVSDGDQRLFEVDVLHENGGVTIHFTDSGPGVAAPENLFQPFRSGADSAGMGMYISRALLRSFGGELKHLPQAQGCRFTVQLKAAENQ